MDASFLVRQTIMPALKSTNGNPQSAIRNPQSAIELVSLGCPKNLVDSEEMLGVLAGDGYAIAELGASADVVVINTCGFIESAKQESIDAILEAVERKKRGDVRKVIVTGCLSQRYGAELAREIPEVDAFLGTGQMAQISQVVNPQLSTINYQLPTSHQLIPEKPHHRWVDVPTRIRATAPWTAYLKISEGCDHRCTFCAIPSFRGPHVSKPLDRVLEEAEMLARQGVKELNLIAQDSTQYGYDLYKKPMLPELLRALSKVEDIRWIRLFYCYPSRLNAAVIEAIATTPRVCQYIDMPLQHADDEILRAMRRPMSGSAYLKLVERFRAASPDVAIRTTFIVGFPGETDTHFENLLRFVEEAQFDRVGVFEYSVEDGTPAAALPDRVPARIKRARQERLMRLQQGISLTRNRQWIGREMEVLVEKTGMGVWEYGSTAAPTNDYPLPHSHTPTPSVGRSFRDAPDVDGQVHITGANTRPGDLITVRITEAAPYDLAGRAV